MDALPCEGIQDLVVVGCGIVAGGVGLCDIDPAARSKSVEAFPVECWPVWHTAEKLTLVDELEFVFV